MYQNLFTPSIIGLCRDVFAERHAVGGGLHFPRFPLQQDVLMDVPIRRAQWAGQCEGPETGVQTEGPGARERPATLVCALPSLWPVLSAQNFSSTFGPPLDISPLACGRVPWIAPCWTRASIAYSLFLPDGEHSCCRHLGGCRSATPRQETMANSRGSAESDSRVLHVD